MPDKRFDVQALFDVRGRTAVITGGSGHFGRAMALALAQAGVRVAILGRHAEAAKTVAEAIQAEGGSALGIACDVLSRASLEQSREQVTNAFGTVDILINAAGGNSPSATTSTEQSFFDLDAEAANHVFGLNFRGNVQPNRTSICATGCRLECRKPRWSMPLAAEGARGLASSCILARTIDEGRMVIFYPQMRQFCMRLP